MSVSTKSSVKKSRNSGCATGEDCISSLPECVISNILSRLQTKDAVRTCVLSKEWEFRWTSIYDIKIDDTGVRSGQVLKKASFVNYVERILLLSHNIRSCRLNCWADYDSSRLITWITAVLRQNVESFELICLSKLLLPRSLLNSISLRRLKLDLWSSVFKVPSKNCFPNLVNLYFHGVDIRNELFNSDTVTFTFPVLETMELKLCEWYNVKFVEINAPVLTKFVSETPEDAQVLDDYSINILAGRLTYFISFGALSKNLILIGSSVVHAVLHNMDVNETPLLESGIRVRRLLNGFQRIEELKLSAWIVEVIVESKGGLDLPKFNKLRQLTLCDGCSRIEGLLEFLHAAPNLKSLVVDMIIEPHGYDCEAEESLPYCLVNQLEEVEFIGYSFLCMYDFHLEKFLLKHGLQLKAFHLRCSYQKEGILEILDSLLTFPKGSGCLKFIIH